MKLQRNNKYSKKIANRISSILLAGSILIGCNSADALMNEPTNLIEEQVSNVEVKDNTPKDENYYKNYYKISEEQKEARIKRLDIKYPDEVILSKYIKTLIVKDNGIYKVLPVLELWDLDNNISIFCDLFTEEKLFEYPYNDVSEVVARFQPDGNFTGGYDFKKITNAIPYFEDKEIVEFGVCYYAETFLTRYINKFIEKDGINYNLNMSDMYDIVGYFYDIPVNSDNMLLRIYDYADNYVTTVPLENQVTSKELGLKSTHRIEEKYSDYWKISNDEINERLNDFDIAGKDMEMPASMIQSLILKDADDNYKLMNVRIDNKDSKSLSFYDPYSEMHLFDANLTGTFDFDFDKNQFVNIDLKNIYNAIPYFEDKEIIRVDRFIGCIYFVSENYEYFVEKDKINYIPLLNKSYYFYMHGENENPELSEIVRTKEEFAKYYIISLPEDLQVTTKDLKIGLEKDKVKNLN